MALFFLVNGTADEVRDLGIVRTAAERTDDVKFRGREQASSHLAIGSKPNTGTGAAERFGNGGDNANAAGRAICEPKGLCCFRAAIASAFNQWKTPVDMLPDLAAGNDQIALPRPACVKRHEFNKANRHGLFTGKGSHFRYFIIISAANDDGIDLDRKKLFVDGGIDRF